MKVERKLRALAATGLKVLQSDPDTLLGESILGVIEAMPRILGDPELEKVSKRLLKEDVSQLDGVEPLTLTQEEIRMLKTVRGGINEDTKQWLINWFLS